MNFDPALDDWIESLIRRLAKLGYRKAARSVIVREALCDLQRTLSSRSDGDLLRFFVDRDVARALAPIQRLERVDNPED